MKIANWEGRYRTEKGLGLLIELDNDVAIDRRSITTTKNGIYDERLGEVIDSDKDIKEYSCGCGSLQGRFFLGETCTNPNCPDPIVKERVGADIRRCGWISVEPYRIMNPNAYEMVARIVGNKRLDEIISYDVDIDLDGFQIVAGTNQVGGRLNRHRKKQPVPFQNIGLEEFYKKFEEIVLLYAAPKGLVEEAKFLISNKESVFSSHIPVTSTYLRPTYTSGKKRTVSFDKINSIYVDILSNVNLLRRGVSNRNKMVALETLHVIQQTLQKLYDFVIRSKLSGKTHQIRGQAIGSRMSWSSRMVIRVLTGEYAGMDHAVMGYKGFLELYILEIMAAMKRGYGDPAFANMTIHEIVEYITKARYSEVLDPKLYAIMEEMVRRRSNTLRILANRPPTLDIGSIICLKIVHVTKKANDYTLAISLSVLKAMGADFDGDTLSVFCLKEKNIIEAFNQGLNPRYLVVDKTGDTLFDANYSLLKDQVTGMVSLNTPHFS
jgi:DNA-directed RNA polymerase beta' subunit